MRRRYFRSTDWSKLRVLLPSTADWHSCLATEDIDQVWRYFINSVSSALDKIAPYKSCSVRNFVSSSKVRTALRLKRRRHKEFMDNPSTVNRLEYERSVIIADKVLLKDLAMRECDIVKSSDPKAFWKYVNCRLSKPTQIKCIKDADREINNSLEIANKFNEYFSSVFRPSTNNTLPELNTLNTNEPTLDSITITTYDVMSILRRLPASPSVDGDQLSYFILKQASFYLVPFLTEIFNLSLKQSRIPDNWRTAIVTPIYKKGCRSSVRNYRPVSVTSCCLRILERLVTFAINKFLKSQRTLFDSQHGFISARSTETLLTSFYDFVSASIDNGRCVDVVFFDFAKAFDTVPHQTLVSRIASCGITGTLLRWISDFLTHRSQRVRINETLSIQSPVTSGVIQGSVLGPTLFNIFINSADTYVKQCCILKYADDLRIFLSSPKDIKELADLHEGVQSDIINLLNWATDSDMGFNVDKCFFSTFGNKASYHQYTMGNVFLPYSCEFKDLGVTVSSPFKFNKHINLMVSKAYAKLGIINKVFKFKNKYAILRLYKSFVRPILEYASLVWSPYTVTYINKIEKVQKRMCRMIPELNGLPYQEQLEALELLSLQARRLRYQLIFLFKMHKGLIDLHFSDYFAVKQKKSLRGHSCLLMQKHANNNYRLNFFTVSSINLWNELTQGAIDAPSVNEFKCCVADLFKKKMIW